MLSFNEFVDLYPEGPEILVLETEFSRSDDPMGLIPQRQKIIQQKGEKLLQKDTGDPFANFVYKVAGHLAVDHGRDPNIVLKGFRHGAYKKERVGRISFYPQNNSEPLKSFDTIAPLHRVSIAEDPKHVADHIEDLLSLSGDLPDSEQ